MIQFKNPQLGKAHSGHLIIELTEAGTWESFPRFASKFIEEIGATKITEVTGPDVRFWDILLNDVKLNLGYDDFPNGLSIMSYDNQGDNLLRKLYIELEKNADLKKGI